MSVEIKTKENTKGLDSNESELFFPPSTVSSQANTRVHTILMWSPLLCKLVFLRVQRRQVRHKVKRRIKVSLFAFWVPAKCTARWTICCLLYRFMSDLNWDGVHAALMFQDYFIEMERVQLSWQYFDASAHGLNFFVFKDAFWTSIGLFRCDLMNEQPQRKSTWMRFESWAYLNVIISKAWFSWLIASIIVQVAKIIKTLISIQTRMLRRLSDADKLLTI